MKQQPKNKMTFTATLFIAAPVDRPDSLYLVLDGVCRELYKEVGKKFEVRKKVKITIKKA